VSLAADRPHELRDGAGAPEGGDPPAAPTELVTAADVHRRYLVEAIARVRGLLELHADDPAPVSRPAPPLPVPLAGTLPALLNLVSLFKLSPFERDLVVLCAAVELDASFAGLCARAQVDPQRLYPTFSLALATLPGAHWDALSPSSSLRHWRLIELASGGGLTERQLRIDERILHYLVGANSREERLAGLIEPCDDPEESMVPSHQAIAERLAATWARTAGTPDLPVVQLCGEEAAGKRAIAAAACHLLALELSVLRADALPAAAGELADLARLWEREGALTDSALLLDCDEIDPADAGREGPLQRFAEMLSGGVILATRQRRRQRRRPLLTFEVEKPTPREQRSVWQQALGQAAATLESQVDAVVAQFNLSAPTIHAVYAGSLGELAGEGEPGPEAFGAALWETCRLQARPRLEDLAQRIVPAAGWDDLVLPEEQLGQLHEIAAHLRHRTTVYDRWGFAEGGARGLGISALFAGASGTGKTMAAEVLARDLCLDLFRIDLSAVVSKYIGETEKNLARVFASAEEGGAILLFDEADALFGKRSEVKDSHDRHANIEVSYLLQRMESYRGLAILTTNLREALDGAFLRRLRFTLEFPFPDQAQRTAIWQRVFPPATPTRELDPEKLARLNLPGGSIRNIALKAAFAAAAAGAPVRMSDLLRAARSEYAKLGKPLPEAEVRGW
jgi:hypothetical protein